MIQNAFDDWSKLTNGERDGLKELFTNCILDKLHGLAHSWNSAIERYKSVLSFVLSLYFVFTTDILASDTKSDNNDFGKNDICILYFHPIIGLYTDNEKRGMFLIAFTSRNVAATMVSGYLKEIREYVDDLAYYVHGLDAKIALRNRIDQSYSHIRLEKLLLECCRLSSHHKTNPSLNLARKELFNKLKTESSQSPGLKEINLNDVAECVDILSGTSNVYCSFLNHLFEVARSNFINKEKKPFKPGQCIFLYSPPGCGKDTLAQLIHLIARTPIALNNTSGVVFLDSGKFDAFASMWEKFIDELPSDVREVSPAHKALIRDMYDLCLYATSQKEVKYKKLLKKFRQKSKKLKIKLEGDFNAKTWNNLLFAKCFFSINCALLEQENVERMLFGNENDEALTGLRLVSALMGTAFLDEVNTMPVGVENKLLRLLADPYEGIMHADDVVRVPLKRITGLNVLYVFASNKQPEELIEAGYNSAFVGRIRQHYFKIPPLCERPEDIALAFSIMLQKAKEDLGMRDRKYVLNWDSIDLNAFRFVCMLPWGDNLRGLKGFVDALALQRRMRKIDTPEISFEEVVECAVQRNLITR